MTWLLVAKWSTIGILWGASVTLAWLLGAAVGFNTATRRHWKMLHRAGSRASGLGDK